MAKNPDGVSGREWCYVEVRSRTRVVSAVWHIFYSCCAGSSRKCRAADMGEAEVLEIIDGHVFNLQDYCAPKVNYAEVRDRVTVAFAEKANEIADATALIQSLSREAVELLEQAKAHCS